MASRENCGGRKGSGSRCGESVPPEKPAVVQAIENLHEAAVQRCRATTLDQLGDRIGASFDRREADAREARAQALLKEPREQDVTRGPGGEVALAAYPDAADQNVGWCLRDTLEDPDLVSATAAKNRMELALGISGGCLSGALDAAETVAARNSAERMLAHQLAAAHEAAMKATALGLETLGKAAYAGQPATVEGCRLLNTAARLMSAYNDGLSTLARIRTGGRQEVVVQHVQVNDGGQAVVAGQFGSPKRGGGGSSKKRGE